MYISKKADDEPAGCEGCRFGAVVIDHEFAMNLFHCTCPKHTGLMTREFWDERESGEPCDHYEFEDHRTLTVTSTSGNAIGAGKS